MSQTTPLLLLEGVRKTFRTPDRRERTVLEGVDFRLEEGEIVALQGKSGSGKSTLLRVMAGLVRSNGGKALYRGQPIAGPVQGISMVFQSFALFPWLTVQQNVELGLEALGVRPAEREDRAAAAIDMIGLGGFEGAYPKELSGGMRQRVGFARALVMNPDILLMDEAFSGLDVLTAENLRDDLLELWRERKIPTKGMLMVSHNIEEAVYMADRVLIFASDPGRVKGEIKVGLEHPRDPDSPAFRQIVDEVYGLMTATTRTLGGAPAEPIHIGYRLPDATPNRMAELLETIAEPPFEGRADVPALAEFTELPDDSLFHLFEGLRVLGLARLAVGDIFLTPAGRAFVEAEPPERKRMFGEHLLHAIPLAARIRRVLDERRDHRAPEERFLQELQDYLSADEAERVLETVITWGRYAEIFDYDYNAGVLMLPEDDDEEPAPPAADQTQ
ncbi:AAA-associated domain-containing protein [Magnetospirillum aberrantis]|uniref:Nitrate/sulfonate/bicarbonate ABC transporter ATP-binding protein n=1 Tax=Magnetospirillum aberrantis SpK TaxID=908842 RepID=A0A7C9UWL4_9PROT|nr:nitrate/sulfonate/bicarbonate ABC transporter ATP-binding protein [Magnetospirillum aberrantis]NFV78511.1 nitrate/sulfonate/bicarbonate ABC transporter ATP-binding protein [Magnetospirillum aberrantis SpK]